MNYGGFHSHGGTPGEHWMFFFLKKKPSLHWMIEGYHHFRKPPYKLGQMGSEKKQLPGALKYLEVTRMDGFYIFE